MDNFQYGSQPHGQDNYYQNLYNMFGGYNPIIDEQAKSIKRFGMLAGVAMILYMIIQNIFALFLQFSGAMELYMSDSAYMNGLNILAQTSYIFIPFMILFFMSKPHERERILVFDKPASTQLAVLAVFAGFGICIVSDFAGSIINIAFSVCGIDFLSGSEDLPMPTNAAGVILMVLSNAVVAPLLEEFAFRGVILQPLRKHGDWFAIIMSSVLFGIMHGNMVQIPFAIIVGIALGYFCIATGSIWTSVAIHSLNNLLYVVFSLLGDKYPGISDFAFYVIEIAIIAIGVIAFILFKSSSTFKVAKDSGELNKKLKTALYLCSPTIVIGIGNSLYTTVSLQNTTSFFGCIVLVALIVVASVFIIKGVNYIKSDTRLTHGKSYTVSKVFTVILLVLGIIIVMSNYTMSFLQDYMP